MARISAEDCLQHIDSAFALVHAAVRRARQLQLGSKPLVEKSGEKPTVTALREIAKGLVEQIPLADSEHEELLAVGVTEDEEFSQLLDSPDLNVQLDLDPEELDEAKAKKKGSKKFEDDLVDEFEELEDDEDDDEDDED